MTSRLLRSLALRLRGSRGVGSLVLATALLGPLLGSHSYRAGPMAEFDRRWRSIDPDDAAGRLEVAEWARGQALFDEADAAYREILDHDPEHDDAYAALLRLAETRRLPRQSSALDDTRRRVGQGFVEHETTHFIILSDATPAWTRAQADRLERAYHQYDRFARRLDLRPLPPRHKLVCVLFESRRDYQWFARRHDHVDDQWVAGYYAPHNDRIVFYDVESNPSVVEARRMLDEMHEEVRQIDRRAAQAARSGEAATASALREHHERYRSHLRLEERRIDTFTGQQGTATTIHEAIHQLLFHSGIQTNDVRYPLWISEGLATTFETDQPGAAFGPDHEFEPRRDQFEAMMKEGALLPLRSLVQLMELGDHDEHGIRAVYHQSYALVTWMQRFRRSELRTYLLRMRDERGALTPARQVELFEEAFGPVEKLDRAWLRHERQR